MGPINQATSTSVPTALNGSHPAKTRKARQPAAASSPKQAARAYANSENFAGAFELELSVIRGELAKELEDKTREVSQKIAALESRGSVPATDQNGKAWALRDSALPAKPRKAAKAKKRGPKAKVAAAKTKEAKSVAKAKAPKKPRAKKAEAVPLIGGEETKVLAAIQAAGAEGILTEHLGKELGFKPGPMAKLLIAAGTVKAKGKNRGTRYFAA